MLHTVSELKWQKRKADEPFLFRSQTFQISTFLYHFVLTTVYLTYLFISHPKLTVQNIIC